MKILSTTIQQLKFERRARKGATSGVPSVAPSLFPRIAFSLFILYSLLFTLSISPASALTSVNTSNSNVVKSGLVGYWTFDGKNMTNTTATDISGNGNHGTLTNMTATSSKSIGKIGQALTFDNTNDYINVGQPANLNITGAMTVSAWIYPMSFGQNSRGRIIDKSDYILFLDNFTNSNTFAFGRAGGFGSALHSAPDGSITLNAWQYIVATYDGTNVRFYKNGVLIGGPTAQDAPLSGANSFYIGGETSGTRTFDGRIDDVRTYNRALSATEIQTLYKSGGGVLAATVPGKSSTGANSVGINSGLVGYWTFDGKNMTNATATDLSGNGNNGTLTNMTQSSAKTNGKLGQALDFGASTDLISIVSSTSINMTSQITISVWVKRGAVGTREFLVSKGQAGADSNTQYWLEFTSGNLIRFLLSSGASSTSVITASTLIDRVQWHHIVGTWDGTTMKVFIDGVQDVNTTAFTGPITTTTDELTIGDRSFFRNIPFSGKIDDVRLYNRSLSATEVQSLYKAGGSVTTVSPVANNRVGINSGLVGYWTFDGKNMTNATATDSSGSGNNGTLTNMTQANSKTIGKLGQGLNFDNINDNVVVSNLQLSNGALSICAWIKPNSQGSGSYARIVTTGGAEYTNFLIDASSRLAFTSDEVAVLYSPTITYGRWMHVCTTRDATGVSGVIYQNGLVTATGTTGTPTVNVAGTYIGNRGGSDRPFDGLIDDVRIYNRQLSATEIRSLYKLGTQ